MTCAEFKELAAILALGALGREERAECEAHLREPVAHDGCAAALRTLEEAAAQLALSLPPIPPSPAVWRSIERSLEGTAAAPGRRRGLVTVVVALAAAAAVVLWVRDRGRLGAELQAAEERRAAGEQQRARCVAELDRLRGDERLRDDAVALLSQPGTRVVGLSAQGGGTLSARVILHVGERRAYLVGRGLSAPAGQDYELWLIRGDRKIAAGLLRGGDGGQLVTAVDPGLLAEGAPDALAVTLEPAGGGPAPRGPIVLLGAI